MVTSQEDIMATELWSLGKSVDTFPNLCAQRARHWKKGGMDQDELTPKQLRHGLWQDRDGQKITCCPNLRKILLECSEKVGKIPGFMIDFRWFHVKKHYILLGWLAPQKSAECPATEAATGDNAPFAVERFATGASNMGNSAGKREVFKEDMWNTLW